MVNNAAWARTSGSSPRDGSTMRPARCRPHRPQSSDICDDANSLGDLISEFAGDPKQALALAACAHEIAVLLLGSTIFGRVFRKGGGHD